MSTIPQNDPQFLPPGPAASLQTVRRAPRIPNFGHLLLFCAVTGGSMLLMQLLVLALVKSLHLFPHEAFKDLATDPRVILPAMFLSYFAAGLFSILTFTAIWHRPFAEGIRWDQAPLAGKRWILLIIGVAVSITVQLLSNFLPIPKELPIDQFFKTPLDVWLIAFFGIFIAPVFEELAFRGFLLPALANTWDFIFNRISPDARMRQQDALFTSPTHPDSPESPSPLASLAPTTDPQWTPAAVLFAVIVTSIAFALLHADQLAHALAPLGVLFCVSVVLCVVRLRWHSLAASALVHACYNGTIFAMLFIGTGGFRHLDKLK